MEKLEGNTPLSDEFDNWAPGQPASWDEAPTLIYQVLAGRVFTLKTWPDGSSARGEVTLEVLEDLTGEKITREGFYNALGEFQGAVYEDETAWARGEDPEMTE